MYAAPALKGPALTERGWPACFAIMRSRCWKSIVLIARCADLKGSPILLMLKTRRVRSSLEGLRLFQRNSQVLQKQCAPFLLPDGVQSRQRHRLSTNYVLCS